MKDPKSWADCLFLAILTLLVPYAHGQLSTHDRLVCATYEGYTHLRSFVQFSEDETMMATYVKEDQYAGYFLILEVPTCNVIRRFKINEIDEGLNRHMAFSYDGRYFAFGTSRRVFAYDLTSSSDTPIIDIRNLRARFLQFTPDGKTLIAKQYQQGGEYVHVFPFPDWNNFTYFKVEPIIGEGNGVTADETYEHDISPDGKYMALLYTPSSFANTPWHEYGELHVYELPSPTGGVHRPVCRLNDVYGPTHVDWSLDGSKLIVTGADGSANFHYTHLYVYDPYTCTLIDKWEFPDERAVTRTSYLDNDHILAVSEKLNRSGMGLSICNLQTREEVDFIEIDFKRQSGQVEGFYPMHVAVSSKGNYFAVTSDNSKYFELPDLALLRWKAPSPTSIEELPDALSLQAYPNPVTDAIRFTQAGQVTLFDVMGREVVPLTTVGEEGLQVDHLSPGVYFYRFVSQIEAVQHSGRFVKY